MQTPSWLILLSDEIVAFGSHIPGQTNYHKLDEQDAMVRVLISLQLGYGLVSI